MLVKIASSRIDSTTASFTVTTAAWLFVALAAFRNLSCPSVSGVVVAAVGGLFGGIASLAFFRALRLADVSVVLPLCNLYMILTVVLAFIFLREPIGIRQVVGIAFGLVAVMLLAR